MTGPVAYWHVNDIAASLEQLGRDGAVVSAGKLVAWVTDADGNPIGLIQDAE